MSRYYITHADHHGERSQLIGAWEAATPAEAIAQMLTEAMAEDDGAWEAHLVTSEDDVIV